MTSQFPFKISVSNAYPVETLVVMFSALVFFSPFYSIRANAFLLWIHTYTSILQCSFTAFLMLAAHTVLQNRDEA